jgi:hypothetical protein
MACFVDIGELISSDRVVCDEHLVMV